jgi:hypothetical protein
VSFREIGERLGVSHEAARQHVRVALRQRAREIAEAADELRAGADARLDRAAEAVLPAVLAGELRAQETWLKNRQRFVALSGLDLARPPEVQLQAGGLRRDPALALPQPGGGGRGRHDGGGRGGARAVRTARGHRGGGVNAEAKRARSVALFAALHGSTAGAPASASSTPRPSFDGGARPGPILAPDPVRDHAELLTHLIAAARGRRGTGGWVGA